MSIEYVNQNLYCKFPIVLYLGSNYEFPYEDAYLMVNEKYDGGFANILRDTLHEDVPDWQHKLRLNTIVSNIIYTDEGVIIETSNGTFKGQFQIHFLPSLLIVNIA